ncbi:MAG: tetratricopeptide repeat protein, partial [Byssovorax sp.]
MSAEIEAPRKAMPRKVRRSEIVLLVFTLAAITGIFALFFLLNASSTVWLVNALDVPVDVLVDGSKTPVEAGAKVDVRLRAGTRDVRVQSLSGELLEEGPFDVPGGVDVVVYNVLGAAPLYAAEVNYGSSYGTPPEPEFLGGQRAISRDHINYVFKEPPSSISVKSGESRIRRRFDIIPGGWMVTVSYLKNQKHQTAAVAELCRAIARAEPENPKALGYARHFTQLTQGIDGQLRFLRGEMERRPEDVDAQLAYASTMRLAGRSDEVRAAYRPRFAANPKSVALGSVLIRVEPLDEA